MTVRSADVSAFYELLYNPKYTPMRSSKAHVEEMTIDGESKSIMIKEPSEYFEIDEGTCIVWKLLDGRKTLNQILDGARQVDEKLTEKDVKDIVLSLAEEGFLQTTEPELEEKRVRIVSAFQVDVRLVKDSSKSFSKFFNATRKLISPIELPIMLAIVTLGIVFSFENILSIMAGPTKLEILGSTLLGLFFYEEIVLLPVYLIHELAHAAVCDYCGAKPREIGTGFFYFAPFFFCDTSDSWRLSRKARIMISVAGPLSTLIMGSIFTFTTMLFPNLGFGRIVLQVAAFFCFYGTLINFSPVIETDGYYILSDILNIPNLRDESFAYLKRVVLRVLGRPVKKVRYSAHTRRILLIYSVISVAWLIFFGYTTIRLTYFYSLSAYAALLTLFHTTTGSLAFSLSNLGISIGSILYYLFLIAGYFVMGVVAYRRIRVRGVKLETIHDKRVSVFLPLPSFIQRERALRLVKRVRNGSRKFTRSMSVVWEAPLCVASLKLGKVEQSLEEVRHDMTTVEKSFRSLHSDFISENLHSFSNYEPSKIAGGLLETLATQFPPSEKKSASKEARKFLDRQDKLLGYLLQSSFGNIWTLELPPDDYRRIRKELFPSLIAEDLGAMDLDAELEHFKRHTVLGLDALSRLSTELGKESSLVTRNPEQFQATALIEPIKSRLVFIGRTEGVERSIVWVGGLFLYQAWTGYISEVFYESAIGLKSLNQAPYSSFGKLQIAKMSLEELRILLGDLKKLEELRGLVIEALGRIRSSYQSASNFHESLKILLEDQSFDIGLYKPILMTDEEHMKSVKDKIGMFEEEYETALDSLLKTESIVNEQLLKKSSESKEPVSTLARLETIFQIGPQQQRYSEAYYGEIKRWFAIVRLIYPVVLESAVVI